MNNIINSLITSRRFWAAVASLAVVVLKDKLPLTEEQITQLVLAVGAWIVGESLRSSQAVNNDAHALIIGEPLRLSQVSDDKTKP